MALRSFRKVYSHSGIVVPELVFIGRVRLSEARVPGIEEHSHSGAYEIFCIEGGEALWWVENENHRLHSRDFYLNRPGEVHGSMGPGQKPCAYLWIQVAFPKGGLPGLTQAQSRELQRVLSDRRIRTFRGTEDLKKEFLRLWQLHETNQVHRKLMVRAQLHLLLGRLAGEMTRHLQGAALKRTFSPPILRAMRLMEADDSVNQPVTQLARVAGLGRTQFNDRFLAETGFTPAYYDRHRRVEKARQWLRQKDWSITRIAAELGFSSSQHFATVFRKIEGIPPGEFRSRQGMA